MQTEKEIKQIHQADFWFEREDGRRYYAKQEGDSIVLLNEHRRDEQVRFGKDKFQQDIEDGKISNYGIE